MKSPVNVEEWATLAEELEGLLQGEIPVSPKEVLTADEINIKLQEAAIEDSEDIVEGPVPIHFTGLEIDVEGWDEYVERVRKEDPPTDEEEV